jgi:hypothetical protein
MESRLLSFDWRKAVSQLYAAESHFRVLAKQRGHSSKWIPSPRHFLQKCIKKLREQHLVYQRVGPGFSEDQAAMQQFLYCFSYSKEAALDASIWQQVYEDLLVRKGARASRYVGEGDALQDHRRKRLVSNFMKEKCDIVYDAVLAWARDKPWYDVRALLQQREAIVKAMGKKT